VTDLTETGVPTMLFDDCAELADDEPGSGVRGEGGSGSTIGEGGDDGPNLDDWGEGGDDGPNLDDWGEGEYDDVRDHDADDGPRDRDGDSRADGAGSACSAACSPSSASPRLS